MLWKLGQGEFLPALGSPFSRIVTVELDFEKWVRFSHYRDILGVEVERATEVGKATVYIAC